MPAPTALRRFAAAVSLPLAAALLAPAPAQAAPAVTTIASGLRSPRQLAFAPNGTLYVAEAGTTGTSNCQTHPEFGNVCFGATGSIARIGGNGSVVRVLTGLPSAGTAGDASGPSDLVFTGNHRVAVTIGLGGTPAYRAGFGDRATLLGQVVTADLKAKDPSRTLKAVFDVAGYEQAKNPDGTDIDSNGTGIARSGNGWVVADAGANDLISSRSGGRTLAVFDPVPTKSPGPVPVGFPADAVPTDVVRGPDGAWYVSQLLGFPFEKGSSTIWRIKDGRKTAYATGLTNVTSLAFGDRGRLFAVQIASNGLLGGPVGSLVEVRRGASKHRVVIDGLPSPYGVAVRGKYAYVTTGSTTAEGTVKRVRV